MKKSIILFAIAAFGFTACTNSADKTAKHKKQGKYICTMHPDISSDKPGVCSKCGMDLVERDTTEDN